MNVIKSSEEISNVFSHGVRFKTRDIIFVALRKEEQHGHLGRVAFIAGKKQGNAVWRNRAKRRMRSVYRDLSVSLDGFDVLFVARSGIESSDYKDMVRRSEKALERLQTIKDD